MGGIDFKTGIRTNNSSRKVGGTSVTPAAQPRFTTPQSQSNPEGYGADRSRRILQADDSDREQSSAQTKVSSTPLVASIAPAYAAYTATPAGATIVSKPGSGPFFDTDSNAEQANQVQSAQNTDFWRNQGVMQNRANESRSQRINDQASGENFKLQMANIQQGYDADNRNAERNNASQLQREAASQAMERQQNANVFNRAINADSQSAETERQRIASNAQLQANLYNSISSSIGGGNFRYW